MNFKRLMKVKDAVIDNKTYQKIEKIMINVYNECKPEVEQKLKEIIGQDEYVGMRSFGLGGGDDFISMSMSPSDSGALQIAIMPSKKNKDIVQDIEDIYKDALAETGYKFSVKTYWMRPENFVQISIEYHKA